MREMPRDIVLRSPAVPNCMGSPNRARISSSSLRMASSSSRSAPVRASRQRSCVFLRDRFAQGTRELVGAGGLLHAALHALDAFDDVLGFLPDDQPRDALQVAVAAAVEADGTDDVIFVEVEVDEAGAGPFAGVNVFHGVLLCVYYIIGRVSVFAAFCFYHTRKNRTCKGGSEIFFGNGGTETERKAKRG